MHDAYTHATPSQTSALQGARLSCGAMDQQWEAISPGIPGSLLADAEAASSPHKQVQLCVCVCVCLSRPVCQPWQARMRL